MEDRADLGKDQELNRAEQERESGPHLLFGIGVTRVIEIAIVVVAIPLLSYLAVRVTAIESTVTNAKLPELASNLAVTRNKVDEIFAQLPSVRMQRRKGWAKTFMRRFCLLAPKTAKSHSCT